MLLSVLERSCPHRDVQLPQLPLPLPGEQGVRPPPPGDYPVDRLLLLCSTSSSHRSATHPNGDDLGQSQPLRGLSFSEEAGSTLELGRSQGTGQLCVITASATSGHISSRFILMELGRGQSYRSFNKRSRAPTKCLAQVKGWTKSTQRSLLAQSLHSRTGVGECD